MRNSTTLILSFAAFTAIKGLSWVDGHLCASKPPDTHIVHPGSTLNLTCRSSNQILVWSKDSKNITNEVISVREPGSNDWSLVLVIPNASLADSGTYKCQRPQGSSYDACEWRLDVFASPSIKLTKPNADCEILIGTSTSIKCQAFGYPQPAYKWIFNDHEVQSTTGLTWHESYIKITTYKYSVLKINFAEQKYSGTYTCISNNSMGQDEKSIYLTVRNYPRPVIHTTKYMVLKSWGQNIDLHCAASDIFKKKTTVSWYHNDSQLLTHKEQFFANTTDTSVTSILRIHNASVKDAGEYWCHVAVYDLRRESSTLLILAQKGLPLVTTEPSIVRTRLGARLILFCTVTYPRYDVVTTSWTKNHSLLPRRYSFSHYDTKEGREKNAEQFAFSVTIKNFTIDDVGEFTCRAESKTGTNFTSIDVQIQSDTTDQKQLVPSNETQVSTSSFLIMFLVVALGSIFGFLTVITVRYLCKAKPINRRLPKYDASEQQCKYETFVSFSNQDDDWVTTNLIPLLEKYTFNYCISRKDFEIGKAIIDNIADSVYQSRTVIAILSRNYMSSNHCQQELDLALYKSAEMDDGSLIVIRVDTIEKSQLPKALRNRTFLDYIDMEERKHWKKRLLRCLFTHTRSRIKNPKA